MANLRTLGALGLVAWATSGSPALAGPPPVPVMPPSPPVVAPRATPAPVATAQSAATAPLPAVRRRPRSPEPPAPPRPEVRLILDAPSPDGPWSFQLENTGAVPLRVLADARLLAFEIVPPAVETAAGSTSKPRPHRPVRCDLPADMRPRDYDERALVLPPGRSYLEKFDPRVFCFGAREAAALTTGASVIAKLVGSRESPAIAPIEEVEPKVDGAREWTGAAVAIGSASVPPATVRETPTVIAPLTLGTAAFEDYGVGWEAEIPTTVKDVSRQSVALLFRPETVEFDVTGPTGVGVTDPSPTVRCKWPGQAPAPILETYTHLGPKQQASISILLSALCPDDTLARPGLYVVRARLETTGASGASVGVKTFTGEVFAANATHLRVRGWSRTAPPPSRPQLVEVAAPSP